MMDIHSIGFHPMLTYIALAGLLDLQEFISHVFTIESPKRAMYVSMG
jgi:hypothetical protein